MIVALATWLTACFIRLILNVNKQQFIMNSERPREVPTVYVNSLDEGLKLFKALGSEIRIEIVKLLLGGKRLSMNEIASALSITNGALTSHIKQLEESGILTVESRPGVHGNQKLCSVNLDRVIIEFASREEYKNSYETQLRVGRFSDYSVYPTCGIATKNALIGEVDDPRYFSHTDRYDADILWFTKGYVEYMIPNLVPAYHSISQISISAELSSEAPGVNNIWPSDIRFYLNGVFLGTWTSPGDFGDKKGAFTPDWWYSNFNQYGLLKLLVVNHSGTYIDGLQISDVTIGDLNIGSMDHIKFRLAVTDDTKPAGGLTIFGESFGNYNQNMNVRVSYNAQ